MQTPTPLQLLHRSCEAGALADVKLQLRAIPDKFKRAALVNEHNAFGLTAVLIAATVGSGEIIKCLIDEGGGSPDIQSMYGNKSPLHLAVLSGSREAVETLVVRDARTSAKDLHGCTALHYAAKSGNMEIVRMLINGNVDPVSNTDSTPLHYAVVAGHKQVVEFLLDRGAAVNSTDKALYTPLHCAAMHDRVDVARLLIARGADVNAIGSNDATPFKLAVTFGTQELVNVLIAHNAKYDKNERLPDKQILGVLAMKRCIHLQ
jgi:cytohesin